MEKRKAVWPWVVLGAVVVGGAGWWLFQDDVAQLRNTAGEVAAPSTAPAAPAAASPVKPAQPAAPQYPLDAAADPALPALADSDGSAWESAGGLFPAQVLSVLLREHLIQRVVVHVDNLTQPTLPASAMALRPLPGTLMVEPGAGEAAQLAAANAARYSPWVDAFIAADAGTLAAAYKRFYPLVQQAYRDSGHPDGHFNDRLVAVIDHLLQAPEPARPLAVVADGKGRYRFVDPALQSLSVGQKALLRMDAAQQGAVKQQLRAVRAAITRG
ncbi:DUF3014 domain-containing protein [Stenotrophomonas sp.]|uniref:DUF3014 domain-containing protein n=1 Tax=Stenotrophomonas sp. TaxID=69392 RepID=UPI0028AD9A6D|nr:DUF3014 domain-containing protein [Stenotrophomonas sp.]